MILLIGSFPKNNKVFGGSTTAMGHLIDYLVKNQIEHSVIDSTATAIPASPLLLRIKKGGTRFLQFIKCLFNKKINAIVIFHGHGLGFIEKGMYALLAKLTPKKVIIAPRSGLLINDLKNPIFLQFAKLLLGKVDQVICQSDYWKNYFESINPNTKTIVIQNWVAMPEELNQQHCSLNVKSSQLNLLYTGWLESWKGIETLIEAIILIGKEDQDCVSKLDIFGSGSLYTKLEKLIKSNNLENKIILHGAVNQLTLVNYHLNSDLFVLPSSTEGMPNALLEAMSYGETCLSTAVTSIPELIDSGVNGILVEPHNVIALKDAILQLAKAPELRKEMGIAARNHIQINNQLEQQVEKLVALCNQKVA